MSPQGERAAVCSDNVTDVSSKDIQSDPAQFINTVDSFICQSTIIPADGRGFRKAISSQSISLADTFVGKYSKVFHQVPGHDFYSLALNHLLYDFFVFFPGATRDTVLNDINANPYLFTKKSHNVSDINFFYRCSMIHIGILFYYFEIFYTCELLFFPGPIR